MRYLPTAPSEDRALLDAIGVARAEDLLVGIMVATDDCAPRIMCSATHAPRRVPSRPGSACRDTEEPLDPTDIRLNDAGGQAFRRAGIGHLVEKSWPARFALK